MQFQQSFKEVVSFVPVFFGCVNIAKRGRRGGGYGERPRERRKKTKHLSAPRSTSQAWPLTHRKPLFQIRYKLVSSARLTCLGRAVRRRSDADKLQARKDMAVQDQAEWSVRPVRACGGADIFAYPRSVTWISSENYTFRVENTVTRHSRHLQNASWDLKRKSARHLRVFLNDSNWVPGVFGYQMPGNVWLPLDRGSFSS